MAPRRLRCGCRLRRARSRGRRPWPSSAALGCDVGQGRVLVLVGVAAVSLPPARPPRNWPSRVLPAPWHVRKRHVLIAGVEALAVAAVAGGVEGRGRSPFACGGCGPRWVGRHGRCSCGGGGRGGRCWSRNRRGRQGRWGRWRRSGLGCIPVALEVAGAVLAVGAVAGLRRHQCRALGRQLLRRRKRPFSELVRGYQRRPLRWQLPRRRKRPPPQRRRRPPPLESVLRRRRGAAPVHRTSGEGGRRRGAAGHRELGHDRLRGLSHRSLRSLPLHELLHASSPLHRHVEIRLQGLDLRSLPLHELLYASRPLHRRVEICLQGLDLRLQPLLRDLDLGGCRPPGCQLDLGLEACGLGFQGLGEALARVLQRGEPLLHASLARQAVHPSLQDLQVLPQAGLIGAYGVHLLAELAQRGVASLPELLDGLVLLVQLSDDERQEGLQLGAADELVEGHGTAMEERHAPPLPLQEHRAPGQRAARRRGRGAGIGGATEP
mmetsp:Transcript_60935/g.191602  ORF Transcript_60935/g.191602 Transcript_60935/m.191602 type:complete len:492 (-) Transcript_60935:7-1482(-)